MQLITFKSLPVLAPALAALIAQSNGRIKVSLGTRYCPAMDLIATYSIVSQSGAEGDKQGAGSDPYGGEDEQAVEVEVWRFNGQRVFSVSIEAEGYDSVRVDVVDVAWRHDGQILAILSSDNVIRLVSSFSGKTVHRFDSTSSYPIARSPSSSIKTSHRNSRSSLPNHRERKPRPKHLSYTTYFSSSSSTQAQLKAATKSSGVVLDDLLGLNADIVKLLKSKADLPRELAGIDVEAFLPRLACLPPAGFGMEDVFSTRASIDAIFHSSKRSLKGGTVDVLAAGTNDGTIHLRIFNTFEIGDVDLSAASGLARPTTYGQVLNVASNPLSNEVFILAETLQSSTPSRMHLLSLDLRFITQSSTTVPVLVTKATQLQNLLRYLSQIQQQLAREVKTAFDLPTRFLRTLNEDLVNQDGPGSSFTTVAFHALVTGEVTGVYKEWLAEILGDRGVKRWEKAVGDCLDLVRRLISEGWIPAVERSGVVISRVTGLATYSLHGDGNDSDIGIDKKVFERLKETVDVMAICGDELLKAVNKEAAGFLSFIKWLKWEVEAAGLEDTSERLDEMREGSDHGEVLKVMQYIESGPASTSVIDYVGGSAKQDINIDDNVDFFAAFKSERARPTEGAKPPTFDSLLFRLKRHCDTLFEQVAHALRDNLAVQYLADLPADLTSDIRDMRVVPRPEYGRPDVHVVALRPTEKEKWSISYTVIAETQTRSGSQKPMTKTTKQFNIPNVKEVMDIKFTDDTTFMVLASTGEDVVIYSHHLWCPGEMLDSWELLHTFRQGLMDAGMTPKRLEVNGRKGRRAVAVIDAENKGYTVFDLDSRDEEDATMAE